MNLKKGFGRDRGTDNREAMQEDIEAELTKDKAARILADLFLRFLSGAEDRADYVTLATSRAGRLFSFTRCSTIA